ncbi:hypothetical protein MAR_000139, partial [Mya arenaria]
MNLKPCTKMKPQENTAPKRRTFYAPFNLRQDCASCLTISDFMREQNSRVKYILRTDVMFRNVDQNLSPNYEKAVALLQQAETLE